jgi:crotonobetainyl-CoA:carnitine CoA-transferase CaiB-like acyl-CoA transferase
MGMLAALLRAERTGFGDVVDAAMVDGAASLMTLFYSLKANGRWTDERGSNVLDGGAPWYDTYETKDGRYMAIGAVEPKFFAELARLIGLDEADVRSQYDTRHWPMLRAKMTGIFASRTRTEWQELLEGTDACATAVLSLSEAAMHPHMQSRGTFGADAKNSFASHRSDAQRVGAGKNFGPARPQWTRIHDLREQGPAAAGRLEPGVQFADAMHPVTERAASARETRNAATTGQA